MKLIVIGATGMLGSTVVQTIKDDPSTYSLDVYTPTSKELDITSHSNVELWFQNFKHKIFCDSHFGRDDVDEPVVVLNCAAMTAVDDCETNFDKSFKLNALGPKNLANICNRFGYRLIHISTDYVFGDKIGSYPHSEYDQCCPLNRYGQTKRTGEFFIEKHCTDYVIIRTAWLYALHGKNFYKTMLKLAETKRTIQVVYDQIGSPTSTYALTEFILSLLEFENRGVCGIIHATCQGEASWAEFAEEIFTLNDYVTKVEKIPTIEFPRPACRPRYSVLRNEMIKHYTLNPLPDWKDELKRVVQLQEMPV